MPLIVFQQAFNNQLAEFGTLRSLRNPVLMDRKRKQIRKAYGKIAQGQQSCGCGPDTKEFAKSIGYSEKELKVISDETNLTLGCGNPTALANLKEDETVLDLGSGAGFDCFLAASRVGPNSLEEDESLAEYVVSVYMEGYK